MTKKSVPARLIGDPRIQARIVSWGPPTAAGLIAVHAIHKTGTTDSLDGLTRLLTALGSGR